MRFFSWTVFCVLLITLTSSVVFAVIPMPARIGGTVTVDGSQLTQATDTGYTFKVTKQNGTAYNPSAEDNDGLNSSNLYNIDIPIYDATDQPGGAQTGETAKIHVYKNGNELQVTSPSNGLITVGDAGSNTTINITAVSLPPGTLKFSSATYNGNENSGKAVITVTRSGGSNGAVSVSYATSDGTATAGSDYVATSGILNWSDGDTSAKTFNVSLIDDSASEGNETVNLILSNPQGGAILGDPKNATLTITDDDIISLNVDITPSNGGTVTGNGINCPGDCSQTYDKGTPGILTATPNSGFVFDHWSGCDSSSGNQCTVAMNAGKSITAYFKAFSGLSLPTGQDIYSYLPVESPVIDTNNPMFCKPVAVGNVTGGTLALQVKVPPFPDLVDIYLLIYAPQLDQENIYLIKSNLSVQPLSMGLVPWKANTYGGTEETLFQIGMNVLPKSIYYLYLLTAPAGGMESFYLWTTYFVNPMFCLPE